MADARPEVRSDHICHAGEQLASLLQAHVHDLQRSLRERERQLDEVRAAVERVRARTEVQGLVPVGATVGLRELVDSLAPGLGMQPRDLYAGPQPLHSPCTRSRGRKRKHGEVAAGTVAQEPDRDSGSGSGSDSDSDSDSDSEPEEWKHGEVTAGTVSQHCGPRRTHCGPRRYVVRMMQSDRARALEAKMIKLRRATITQRRPGCSGSGSETHSGSDSDSDSDSES